jgi:hypothetical protein
MERKTNGHMDFGGVASNRFPDCRFLLIGCTAAMLLRFHDTTVNKGPFQISDHNQCPKDSHQFFLKRPSIEKMSIFSVNISQKILFVDDQKFLLEGIQRQLYNEFNLPD